MLVAKYFPVPTELAHVGATSEHAFKMLSEPRLYQLYSFTFTPLVPLSSKPKYS